VGLNVSEEAAVATIFKIYPENGGNTFVRNDGKLMQDDIKLESRILLCQIVYIINIQYIKS